MMIRRERKLNRSRPFLILTNILLTIHFTLLYQRVGERKFANTAISSCASNFLNCGFSVGRRKNIGILLTKDDGEIMKTWFEENSRYFSALVVLDGSFSNASAIFFSQCRSVFYYHEKNISSLKFFSDGELRKIGHDLVTNLFGYGVWITMAHSDEFYYHSPLKIMELAEKYDADFVKWRALHVLPHPSEYKDFLENPDAPARKLFRHYYHFGPEKGSFLESRMFLNKPNLQWDSMQGSILPKNLRKPLLLYPAYLHYKISELSLEAYTPEGVHKKHWNMVSDGAYRDLTSKRGTGIRWKVHSLQDFFVDHFPNSKKYNYVSLFENNSIESYLDIGKKYVDTSIECVSQKLYN